MSDRAFGRDRLERSRSYPGDPGQAKKQFSAHASLPYGHYLSVGLGLSFGHRCTGRGKVWYNCRRCFVRFARKRRRALWGR